MNDKKKKKAALGAVIGRPRRLGGRGSYLRWLGGPIKAGCILRVYGIVPYHTYSIVMLLQEVART